MALGGNSNASDNANGTKQDGDVLAQLAANRATVKDVYLLEKGMNTTLNKIAKNQEKSNSVLSNLLGEVKAGHRVLSSVDTKLQQLINQLSAGSNKVTPGSSDLETNVLDIVSYVNDCSSYLDEIRELLKNIDDRGETMSGTPTDTHDDATKADTFEDINDTLYLILDAINYNTAVLEKKDPTRNKKEDEKSEREKAFAEIQGLVDQLNSQSPQSSRMNLQQDAEDAIDGLLSNILGSYDIISESSLKKLIGSMDKWGSGEYVTKDLVGGVGGVLGDVAGGAISTAINAVAPGLGSIIGNVVDKAITKGFEALGEYMSYFANHARETRDAMIKAALDKIKKDVQDMATYSVEIQQSALNKIYDAWDQNLSTVTATQGYTKEALNTLQDSVAQRLQAEGYANAINAADYVTQLSNTLNAKLGGELAEAFAAQNLILQKAVPELDLSSMAADFAAIYTNAEKQGLSGESEMINAMNQIAGAVKALEEVTGGNNQFINQVGTFLKKAEEVVIRSGGTTDQIVELTTQMMAAEAPLAALTPQLSGFTNTIVDALMNSNESTAVALRAITHDIDSSIGVSMTDFTNSFMEDTQGTLTAVYKAIDNFINTNANEGARQEFLSAMQTTFGLQASQIAQIDFGDIAEQVASANVATNTKALTAAENLVRSGETTSWEDQLVNNTANQLLATNAVRDTIDNKLMRKLEQNELELEKTVYALESTQTVDFAEKTLAFFTNILDVVTSLLDPLGLIDGLTTMADVWKSTEIDTAAYNMVATASSIESAVMSNQDKTNADLRTLSNQWGTAQSIAVQATTGYAKNMDAYFKSVEKIGTADTFDEMLTKHAETVAASQEAATEAQIAEIQAQRAQQEAQRKQQEQAAANQAEFDNKRTDAVSQIRTQKLAEQTMITANHDNIEAIRESVSKLDELSNYLSPILDENRNQSNLLQTLSEKVDQLIQTVAAKAVTTTVTSPTPNVNTSYNERDRIYGPVKTW